MHVQCFMRKALILAALLSSGGVEASGREDVGLLREIERVRYELERVVHRSCSSELADKAEDVDAKLEAAGQELDASSPDEQAAAGALEGAIGDLAALVEKDCFAAPTGIALMDDLAGISRSLASEALRWARRHGDKDDEIDAARHALARGDTLRTSGRRGRLEAFKEAASAYREALSKAESAID